MTDFYVFGFAFIVLLIPVLAGMEAGWRHYDSSGSKLSGALWGIIYTAAGLCITLSITALFLWASGFATPISWEVR